MDPLAPLNFYDFLDRMRHPSAVDLVRSIKSFIVSFSFHAYDAERDSKKLQDFLVSMESIFRDHPLWAGATEEEIDNAVEGLEKYLMAKLFNRVFALVPEDSKRDMEIMEKIQLLQSFIKPEHLDIPKYFQNEASWLLAEKELQKINAFKSPREKLLCIFSCCRVINNLLLNVSMASNHKPAGADDFLPVLIYANPPQLHSNLKYIQLYRRQSRLVSEAAYYFTNLVSVGAFIIELNAQSLSMDENEFERCMQAARSSIAKQPPQSATIKRGTFQPNELDPVIGQQIFEGKVHDEAYPFMDAEVGDLKVDEVELLLRLYKDVVVKYSRLRDAVKSLSLDKALTLVAMDERSQLTSKPEETSRPR
ncbi:Vacuolar sorting-associated protein 9A [Nymphaea thermarum]|nr:Vacuolar sorting-associated protein 9A [Nymphaea thermarum]